jgi:hypothetical protein
MTEIVLIKSPSGALVPADPQATEFIAKLKMGAGVRAKVVRQNNVKFHRKLFALFNVAFDAWEPAEKQYKGQVIAKNFDQFRNDITVLAGFYESTITLRGEVRLVAKSLNFASMDQTERERLYEAVIGVVLAKILRSYTRADLDNVVDQVLAFAS